MSPRTPRLTADGRRGGMHPRPWAPALFLAACGGGGEKSEPSTASTPSHAPRVWKRQFTVQGAWTPSRSSALTWSAGEAGMVAGPLAANVLGTVQVVR